MNKLSFIPFFVSRYEFLFYFACMIFYCYILKLSDGRHYTGITNNLTRRLNDHNSGRSKFTSRFVPVQLIHYEEFSTRKLARQKEVFIKNKGARRYLLHLRFLWFIVQFYFFLISCLVGSVAVLNQKSNALLRFYFTFYLHVKFFLLIFDKSSVQALFIIKEILLGECDWKPHKSELWSKERRGFSKTPLPHFFQLPAIKLKKSFLMPCASCRFEVLSCKALSF